MFFLTAGDSPTPQPEPTPIPSPTIPVVDIAPETIQIDKSTWTKDSLPIEQLSMKYPPTWTVTGTSIHPPAFAYDTFVITSPNKFELRITTGANNLNGECDEICQEHNLPNLIIGTLDYNSLPFNIIVNGFKDTWQQGKAITQFTVLPDASCFYPTCYGYKSRYAQGTTVITGGFAGSDGIYKAMPVKEFIQTEDVKTAVEILKTFVY